MILAIKNSPKRFARIPTQTNCDNSSDRFFPEFTSDRVKLFSNKYRAAAQLSANEAKPTGTTDFTGGQRIGGKIGAVIGLPHNATLPRVERVRRVRNTETNILSLSRILLSPRLCNEG